ncbi:PadR family transcriptional regulator [Occultella glacieicola]|uniref:PadR family transcriptional regulator n=1 Tax=Occultella glacieicola TaxID=2518684 RepID=A0ABY2E8D2_9MICO|nr:PadR family transcriptional regulator [Occultella glacieicola]TDE98763.1 PadR family transcriptional regulator [Occultella glacieicola]
MGSRSEVLELAILGQLHGAPMHGYELRKRLNATLGMIRALSYGSLYPGLRALQEGGWIRPVDTADLPHALAGRRTRIVYELTDAGRDRLGDSLARAEPAAWEDENFDVRFSLFSDTDAETRLRILEGRRMRMVERHDAMRQHAQRSRERRDRYTLALQQHGLDQIEREVRWLEDLIHAERHPDAPTVPTPSGPGEPDDPTGRTGRAGAERPTTTPTTHSKEQG